MSKASAAPIQLLSGFCRVDAIPSMTPVAGLEIRPISGANMTLSFVSFDVGAVAPLHTHAQEQMGIVLEGQMEFEIDGQRQTIGPGEVYSVPSNVPHGARAVGAKRLVALDVFTPRRDDFTAVARGVQRGDAATRS